MHVLRLLSIKVFILLKKNKDSKPQISFTRTKFKQHRYIVLLYYILNPNNDFEKLLLGRR